MHRRTYEHFGLVLITLIACGASAYSLMYAECYAYYLSFQSAAKTMMKELGSSSAGYCRFEKVTNDLSGLYLIFLAPAIAALASGNSPTLRGIWISVSIIVLVWCVSFIGSGGDRKGCVACESIVAYFVLVPIPAMASFVYCLFKQDVEYKENEK